MLGHTRPDVFLSFFFLTKSPCLSVKLHSERVQHCGCWRSDLTASHQLLQLKKMQQIRHGGMNVGGKRGSSLSKLVQAETGGKDDSMEGC